MKKKFFLVAFFLLFISSQPAFAATDYDFSGVMTYHNDVLQFNFSVSTTGTRTFFSSSWDEGNFDPMLGLWTASGTLINFQDDGGNEGSTLSNGVSYSHGIWDSYYDVLLDPGSYILTLSTYPNWNNGNALSDGFEYDNQTPILITEWNQPANGVKNNAWAFHILNVDEATGPGPAVPEPGTAILLGAGLLGMLYSSRRKS
ncbi:MAG: DVUA0089 family protein [Desulfomicrobium sp.]|nr:DVUA0089 family protein [Desulfomicrobium sp.]